MLDLPGQPLLDKLALVGGCLRLPLRIDADRLRTEISQLPESFWGTTGGRVGVHREVQALFLRGYAPAEGDRPRHCACTFPSSRTTGRGWSVERRRI
jgi:hypothetical protein